MEEFKIKPLTKNQVIISIDRLTRFKNPYVKYLRVFNEIILSNLIKPKYKKAELEELNSETIKKLAEKIINFSLKEINAPFEDDFTINQQLYDYENSIFNINQDTEVLIKNKINYKGFLSIIEGEQVPLNLKWLNEIADKKFSKELRYEKSLHYPIEKVLICEGITEETLLPVFGKICGFDFDKNGIHVISAGGKNQVVKTFYKLSSELKIPIFVLLDNDAKENLEEIKPKLRSFDKIHIIKSGEFEDLLTRKLIEKTLNYAFKNVSLIDLELLNEDLPTVKILEEIFRNRGMHEFKKSEFAEFVKINTESIDDLSDEIIAIIEELKTEKKGQIVPS